MLYIKKLGFYPFIRNIRSGKAYKIMLLKCYGYTETDKLEIKQKRIEGDIENIFHENETLLS
jgi:hypothetical protein